MNLVSEMIALIVAVYYALIAFLCKSSVFLCVTEINWLQWNVMYILIWQMSFGCPLWSVASNFDS